MNVSVSFRALFKLPIIISDKMTLMHWIPMHSEYQLTIIIILL